MNDEENKFINNNTQNSYQTNLDNYFNCILNNANNFCKFNCSSPLYFLTPFFPMRAFDNNIMYDNIQMQVNYNNYINNLNNINNINKIKIDKSYYSVDKNQDSNSSSVLSTTSDGGDQGNSNMYIVQEKKNSKDDKKMNELIEKSLKEMKDYYNSFESLGAVANLACFYYCNLEAEDSDFFVNTEITKLCENYDKIVENDSERKKEMKKYLL